MEENKITVALKQRKCTIYTKEINSCELHEFLSNHIRSPIEQVRHPTMNDIVICYHERLPGEPKEENFSIGAKGKNIYGDAVFLKTNNNKVSSLNNEDFQNLLKTFRNYKIEITKQYIKEGGN